MNSKLPVFITSFDADLSCVSILISVFLQNLVHFLWWKKNPYVVSSVLFYLSLFPLQTLF